MGTTTKLCIAIFLMAALSACAAGRMSESRCLSANWAQLGNQDIFSGQPLAKFDDRQNDCAEYGIAVDKAAYLAGRRQAQNNLCNPDGGFNFARRGLPYRGICGASAEEGFLIGYISGRRLFELNRVTDSLRSELRSAQSSLDYHYDRMRTLRYRLKNDELTDKERRALRSNLRYSRSEVYSLERRIEELIYAIGRADADFDYARATIADYERTPEYEARLFDMIEVNALARLVPGIDYCVNRANGEYDCYLNDREPLRDTQSGNVCVFADGVLRTRSRTITAVGAFSDDENTFSRVFRFYPFNEGGRTPARREAGRIIATAFFDPSMKLRDVRCIN